MSNDTQSNDANKENISPALYKKGDKVQLHGLNKKNWNGKHAIITGSVIIKENVRRWPIYLKSNKSQKASIKEINIRPIGKVTVIYQTRIKDPVDEEAEYDYKFQHKVDKYKMYNAFKNKKETEKIMQEIANIRHDELLFSYEWHCANCCKQATKLLSHPISYLDKTPAMIIDVNHPCCDRVECQVIIEQGHEEMLEKLRQETKLTNM